MDCKIAYYSSLIHLFYTNLSYEQDTDTDIIRTLVKNVDIELTTKSIGKTLYIPYEGLDINDIKMDD